MSVLSAWCSVLSALGAQCAWCSVLGAQPKCFLLVLVHRQLSTEHRAPSTEHSALLLLFFLDDFRVDHVAVRGVGRLALLCAAVAGLRGTGLRAGGAGVLVHRLR